MMISSTSGIRIRLVALAAITLLALQTLGAGATHRVGHLIDDLTSGAAKALDDAADAASSANKLRPAPGVVAPPVVNKVSPIIGQLPSRPLPALPPPAPRYDVAPALPPINYGGLGEVKIPQVVKQSPPTANLLDPTRKAGDLSPAGAP